ncbi:hypothetical protein GCM10022419_079620 [Nonomuraea rosea]|uniref:Uncharacterized protein n=1 Tax=Nonomuraea rosea TaxID=638574 RepID=A0ABP6YQW7_9ACTN
MTARRVACSAAACLGVGRSFTCTASFIIEHISFGPSRRDGNLIPAFVGVTPGSPWPAGVGITGTEDLALLERLLSGGSATELVVNAWNGGVSLASSLILLAPTLSWVVVAVALAFRIFRWEPAP